MSIRYALLLSLLTLAPAAVAAPAGPAAPPASCKTQMRTLPSGISVFRDCADAPEMIALSGGTFRMGDRVGDGQPYERPEHDVEVQAFAVGRFELTNAEWQACVAAQACAPSRTATDDRHGRYPVTGISWPQAQAYVDWLAARSGKPYRLLSEAEWEYAARAGNEGRYPWGSFDPDVCNYGNMLDASGMRAAPEYYWAEKCDDHYATTAPVGSFPANDWGLYDMLGNVWEWVGDCWHADYTRAPADGSTWLADACRKRVNRGGGWGNNVRALRLSSRDADPADAYSNGLGVRVARSVSASEMPRLASVTPDRRVAVTSGTTFLSKPRRQRGAAPPPQIEAPPVLATSTAIERQLEVHISVLATQNWKNGMQHSDGNSTQEYTLSTRLRSDGVVYGENLLDADLDARLAIKQQYLARRGLIRLKEKNGRLPRTADELAALNADNPRCGRDERCVAERVEFLAAVDALQHNTVEDLEAFVIAPATGAAARWLYFTGYGGCPNSIRIKSETHIAGERAYNKARDKLVPWSLDRSADSEGSDEDRAQLCQRYTATVDLRSGDIYLENLYIPSPRGSSTLRINRTVTNETIDLPIAAEMLTWSSARVRKTRETADFNATLPATTPFDGDSTVLGSFTGRMDVTMNWSFKPVPGAAQATMPKATPNP